MTHNLKTWPVLGRLHRDPSSEFFGSGFKHFQSDCLVSGLAKVTDKNLEILAVISDVPGAGNFRTFIVDLKMHYLFIRFWALMNPTVKSALERYGFQKGNDMDQFGDVVDVMDWHRNHVKTPIKP